MASKSARDDPEFMPTTSICRAAAARAKREPAEEFTSSWTHNAVHPTSACKSSYGSAREQGTGDSFNTEGEHLTYGAHANNAKCLAGNLGAEGLPQAALLKSRVLLAHPLCQHQQRHQR